MLFEGRRCCTCKENNSTPRLSWKKGVIEKLIIGNGKNVRGASVRTKYRKSTKAIVLNRPLQLLIPLELSSSENVETIEKIKTNRYKALSKKIVILHQMKTQRIEDQNI